MPSTNTILVCCNLKWLCPPHTPYQGWGNYLPQMVGLADYWTKVLENKKLSPDHKSCPIRPAACKLLTVFSVCFVTQLPATEVNNDRHTLINLKLSGMQNIVLYTEHKSTWQRYFSTIKTKWMLCRLKGLKNELWRKSHHVIPR